MDYLISDKMASMQPSAVREILKLSNQPGVIPFSAGSPATEALPVEIIRETIDRILLEEPQNALQYAVSEGYEPLREAVRERMRWVYGVGGDNDDVLICSGAQQVMDLTAHTLCNEGDVVICETPSFVGALNCFRSYNTRLVGIPVEEDGLSLRELENALKNNPNARFIYTIPNFHNPTGITMSLEKRREVYRLAKQYGVMILEDNPYGDLRFAGDPLPSIKSMDTEGLVIYAGTFSKILSPGIRVGYAITPRGLMPKLTTAKQCSDVHTTILAQMLCYRFLTENDLDEHIRSISKVYARKCALMLERMDRLWNPAVEKTRPQGGLFIWCTLPEEIDMPGFCKRAVLEHQVAVVPGNAFLTDDKAPCRSIRVNFSTPDDDSIRLGVQRLAPLTRA